MTEKNKILEFLKRIKQKLFRISLRKNLADGLFVGLCLTMTITGLSMLIPIYDAILLGLFLLLLCLIAFLIKALITKPNLKDAAKAADSKSLEERMLTAYENLEAEDSMALIQRRDTVQAIQNFDLKTAFAYKARKYQRSLTLFMLFFTLLFCFVDSPAKQKAEAHKQVEKAAEEKKEELEKILETAEEAFELSDEELKNLEAALDTALKELKNATSEGDIKKASDRFEMKLSQELQNNYEEAAVADKEKLQELAKLSESFKDMMEKVDTQNSDKNYASSDSDSSTQLAQGNNQNSQSSQQGQSQNNQNSQSGQTTQNQSSQSQGSQSQSTQNQNGQSGPNGENSQQGQSQSGQGQAGQDGQGQTGQNGQGNQSQNGQSGTGTGGQDGEAGQGWNTGSDKGNEEAGKDGGTLTDPSSTDGADLSGKNNGSKEESQYTKSGNGLTFAGEAANYQQIISEYTEKAYSTLESSNIPEGMKDIVKNYFSDINQ